MLFGLAAYAPYPYAAGDLKAGNADAVDLVDALTEAGVAINQTVKDFYMNNILHKHVEMVALKEVQGLTGYLRGGCSPLAAKKNYPVYLDATAENFASILISAGLRGVQLELAPHDLARACQGHCASLTREPSAS